MHDPRSLMTASIIAFAFVMAIGSFSVVNFFEQTKFKVAALEEVVPEVPAPVAEDTDYIPEGAAHLVSAKHLIRGTEHTIHGEVVLPNSCTLLSVAAEIHDTEPPLVQILFTTAKSAGVICEEAETPMPFSVEFSAPSDVVITALWNQEDVVLSLIKQQ